MKRKMVMLTDDQDATLRRLHQVTRIAMNVLVREALDDLFLKYRDLLEGKRERGKARKRKS